MDDIVRVLAVIILWAGGYLAAPLVFMATMGVFRNIVGMGTGPIKALSGKMRAPGQQRRAWGRASKDELRAQKAQMKGAQRWGNVHQAKDATVGRAKRGTRKGLRRVGANSIPGVNIPESGSDNWSEFDNAFYASKKAQNDPRVQAGHLTEQAANIQASAGTINADMQYTVKFNELTAAGAKYEKDPGAARKEALNFVQEQLNKDLSAGTATQSQVTGTLTYLAQNKAVDQINGVQEHIATLSGDEGVKATQLYGSALGNSSAYGALTGLNAGYKNVPSEGADMKQARANAMITEQLGKVAGSDAKSWAEAASVSDAHRVEVAKRLGELNAMGGPTAQGLQIPAIPKDATGAPDTTHRDYATIKNLHDEIRTSADPQVQALISRLS